jgi:chromosomal replication initiation ATPase DnaA
MIETRQGAGRRRQLALEFGYSDSSHEADFIVGEGNQLAYGHVLAYPDWPAPLALLVGPAKAGKSHLARIWMERSGAVQGSPRKAERLSRAGGRGPILLEDIDRGGYDERALFHLLNQSIRDNRPLLMTARTPIAGWPFSTDDLKSRARLAAQFAVTSSDDIQLSQMFVKLFGDRQISVDPKVIGYLVARMERSAEEAVLLAGLLDRMALERGTAVTRAIAADALALRDAMRDDGQLALDLEGTDDE